MKLNALRSLLLLLFLPFELLAANHCVVLQYHHVSWDTPGITSVTPEQFQNHLDYLKKNDFQVMRLSDVVAAMTTGEPLPDYCVALSVDDAFPSIYSEAWPRAKRYGFPLTVFVSTAEVDAGNKAFLSWSQMREMAADGVEFQNHSHHHSHLNRLRAGESVDDWEQRVAMEILLAQNRITEELGKAPTLFAYPYGESNVALQKLVRSMGLVGFGQQSGPVWSEGNLAALPRFPMNALYARMRTFPTKVRTLPLPVVDVFPIDALVDDDEWQPSLTLTFAPDVFRPEKLTCYVNGSPDVDYQWLDSDAGLQVRVTPKGVLHVGRNRYNCTLPSKTNGRYHWYSHVWLRRHSDGSWYAER